MLEFDGLWKHEKTNQHTLVPPKTEWGCPSGGGIKNGHIRYPLLWRNAERKNPCILTLPVVQRISGNIATQFAGKSPTQPGNCRAGCNLFIQMQNWNTYHAKHIRKTLFLGFTDFYFFYILFTILIPTTHIKRVANHKCRRFRTGICVILNYDWISCQLKAYMWPYLPKWVTWILSAVLRFGWRTCYFRLCWLGLQ